MKYGKTAKMSHIHFLGTEEEVVIERVHRVKTDKSRKYCLHNFKL